jgi:hypothetical protein
MADPNNPHTAAYARRIAELKETVRVQGERLKLLDFAGRRDVWISSLGVNKQVDEYSVLLGGSVQPWLPPRFGSYSPSLEDALKTAMDFANSEATA